MLPLQKSKIMKKFIPLAIIALFIVSCEDSNPITITATTSLEEAIPITIPQTIGTAHSTDVTIDEDLSNIIDNLSDVNSIDITGLSYQFKNVTGNTDAVIQNATLVINGITVATISNININQEANNGTVFSISDEGVLNQLEDIIFNNSLVSINYASSTLSDQGSVSFDLEISIQISATLN